MLGWELPPHNCGGLGVACYQMSKALAAHGITIDFVVPYSAEHPNITHMNIHAASPLPPGCRDCGAYDHGVEPDTEDGDEHGLEPMRRLQRRYGKNPLMLANVRWRFWRSFVLEVCLFISRLTLYSSCLTMLFLIPNIRLAGFLIMSN